MFLPVARHFRFDLAMFDIAISLQIPRHFRFDLAIFAPVALNFCLDLLNLAAGVRHFCLDLTNFTPVARNLVPRPCDFFASSSSFLL